MKLNDFRQSDLLLSGFWRQAQRSPQKTAIRYGQEELTYQQLLRAVETVSEFLHTYSIHHGSVVAIALERSLWHIPVFLGVMNSGAIYVPLDASQPIDRLLNILKRSDSSLLISDSLSLLSASGRNNFRAAHIDDLMPLLNPCRSDHSAPSDGSVHRQPRGHSQKHSQGHSPSITCHQPTLLKCSCFDTFLKTQCRRPNRDGLLPTSREQSLDEEFVVCRENAKEQAPLAVFSDRQVMHVSPLAPKASIEQHALEQRWQQLSGQTAYIIFTSGSTGQPKGVRISHGALNAFLWAMYVALDIESLGTSKDIDSLGASKRADNTQGASSHHNLASMPESAFSASALTTAAITTVAFDIAALEMYLPLLVGGTVEVFSSAESKDADALSRHLAKSAVNVFQATPVTYRLLLESGWPSAWQPRKLLCGGDTLPSNLAQSLLEVCEAHPKKPAELWNMFGPTETTVWSLVHRVTSADQVWIGGPIPGTQCWVVGDEGKEIDSEGVGELYIGGLGVAEGYHQDPKKTANSFVEFVPLPRSPSASETSDYRSQLNPLAHSSNTSLRVYKTGDSVEKLSNGLIRHIGRKDFQVKVRSHLVELTEIEASLVQMDAIQDAIVVAVPDSHGDKVLRACYTSDAGEAIHSDRIRKYLAGRLPEYMVPITYEWRPSFPVNTNGKIDRKALTADLLSSRETPGTHDLSAYLESLTPSEIALYETWCGVIGIPDLPQDANFFDMGGRSLGRLIVTNKAEKLFGKKIKLSLLYRYPTFNEYVVKAQLPSEEKDGGLILKNKGTIIDDPDHYVLFVGGVDVYQNVIEALPNNVAAFTLCIEEERHFMDEVEQGKPMSLSGLADHYVKTIIADFWRGEKAFKPLNICGVSFGGMLAIEVASQMQHLSKPIRSVCMLDSILMHEVTYNPWIKPIDILEKIVRSPSESLQGWSNRFLLKKPTKKESRQAEFRAKTMNAEIANQQQEMHQRRDKALNIAMDREAKKLHNDRENKETIDGFTIDYKPLSFTGDILLIKANDHSEYGRSAIFKDDYGWNALLKREEPIIIASSPGSHLGMLQKKEAEQVAHLMVEWITSGATKWKMG